MNTQSKRRIRKSKRDSQKKSFASTLTQDQVETLQQIQKNKKRLLKVALFADILIFFVFIGLVVFSVLHFGGFLTNDDTEETKKTETKKPTKPATLLENIKDLAPEEKRKKDLDLLIGFFTTLAIFFLFGSYQANAEGREYLPRGVRITLFVFGVALIGFAIPLMIRPEAGVAFRVLSAIFIVYSVTQIFVFLFYDGESRKFLEYLKSFRKNNNEENTDTSSEESIDLTELEQRDGLENAIFDDTLNENQETGTYKGNGIGKIKL